MHASYKNSGQIASHFCDLLWRHFKVFELTEVMRQRVNYALIDFLNNVQIPGPQPLI